MIDKNSEIKNSFLPKQNNRLDHIEDTIQRLADMIVNNHKFILDLHFILAKQVMELKNDEKKANGE